MSKEKLPEAPKQYDKSDQDRTRRLIERALSQPAAAGTIQVTQVVKQIVTVARLAKAKVESSIAVGATATGNIDIGVPSAMLLKLSVDKKCWLRFYATSADQAADAARLRTIDPTAGQGCLGEFIITSDLVNVILRVAPVINLYNNDNPIGTLIYYAITNDEGSSASPTMTLTIVEVETKP